MARRRTSVSALIAACTVLLGCCRPAGSGDARMFLLTGRPWKYKSYVVDGRELDPPADSIEFRSDGSSVLSDGTNTTEGSKWELSGDHTLIFNRGTSSETSVEIIELTRDTFKFKSVTTDTGGRQVPFEASCVH
ncbi:MAG TPA: hypothetical protein VI756_30070 [Blastocatellia bacterium]